MDSFCSKMLMLLDNLSTEPAACSGMKCPNVIETGQFKQSRNMQHSIEDNQNDGKKIIVIGQFKK